MSDTFGHHVHSGDGRRLRLGPMIKSGGAGSIHRLPESPHQVAKIYHRHVELSVYERKVEAMLALSPELPDIVDGARRYVQIAWPQSALRDPRGRFVGFLMPTVDVQATSELETILQERQARAAGLPTGLGAKVTLAANLAAVVAELHRRGHHVVDLKPVNLRFYPQSLYMAMLDCDGFSIRGPAQRYTAPQFTPDYLAPEFQHAGLSDAGEESQDRFALAVVVFQLLNFGIHPFTGRPAHDRVPTDIPGRIAAGCYAYGERANASLAPSPVSGHATLPGDLRRLFDRAFVQRGDLRPAATEWATLLRHFAQRSSLRLVSCSRNTQHQHFAGAPCAACAREALIAQTAQRTASARRSAPATPSAPWLPASQRPRPGATAPAKTPLRPRWTTRSPAATRPTPVPANRWTPAPPSTPGAPPPPNWPQRRFPVSNWRQGKVNEAVIKVTAFLVMFAIIRACNAIGGESASRRPPPPAPITSPAPARAPAAASRPAVEELDRARRAMDGIAKATLTDNLTARVQALRSLRWVSGRERSPGPRRAEAVRPQVRAYLQESRTTADAERPGRIAGLQQALQAKPTDAEAAFLLGWLHLQAGEPQPAQDNFVRAVWADPGHAAAWFGYAVTLPDLGLTVGALAQSEMSTIDADASRRVEDMFPPELRRATRDDPERFRRLLARARVIAANMDGEAVDPATAALAREPLPAR